MSQSTSVNDLTDELGMRGDISDDMGDYDYNVSTDTGKSDNIDTLTNIAKVTSYLSLSDQYVPIHNRSQTDMLETIEEIVVVFREGKKNPNASFIRDIFEIVTGKASGTLQTIT